jgi:hypothetical protein
MPTITWTVPMSPFLAEQLGMLPPGELERAIRDGSISFPGWRPRTVTPSHRCQPLRTRCIAYAPPTGNRCARVRP